MNIGDYLLNENLITLKQRREAERRHDKTNKRFGACLIDLEFISEEDLDKALNEIDSRKKGKKTMPTQIGENTAFQMDLKFFITILVVLVSACGVYFSLTGQVDDNQKEINNIKSMGDLKIISYKLEEYDETFKELKSLNATLSPLASDLDYIKSELKKLKNKEIDMSGIDNCLDKLDALSEKMSEIQVLSVSNQERLNKLEKRNSGGSRF